jgi:DNA polymerase-3 subunit alpha
MTQFVSLHVHTYFSLLDGLSSPKSLVARAKELNHPGIAISDHGVMHGAVEMYRECLSAGIKPIIGCEAYLKHPESTAHLKDFVAEGDGDYKVKGLFHQLILAMTPVGYRNLCKLTSIAHLTEGRGQKQTKADTSTKSKSWMLLEELEQYNEGLIVTSGCMAGIIPQALRAGDMEYAEQVARRYQSIFGDRFYIEIQDHGADDCSDWLNVFLVGLADKLGIEVVATADNHYTSPCQKQAHDALLCINTGKLLSDEKRMRYEGAYWLPTGDEMVERLSRYLPYETAVRAVENTVAIANRVEDYKLQGTPTPPKFSLPADYESADDYLEDLAYEGLRKRFYAVPPKEYAERLQYELDVFRSKNLAEYFLVVGDICRFCREQGIYLGPGRGSAAGSLVSYALQITNIDPVHFGLIFSRFLNEERMSYPDIDLDIDKERRHEVIEYLQQKYGARNVAQIATFNKLVSASAIKDAARVLDVNHVYVNSITTKIPVVRGNPAKLSEMIVDVNIYPDFYQAYQKQAGFKECVDLAIAIEGTVKSVGIHAAGVVIGWEPLDELIPLMRSKEGGTVAQYSMEDLEYLGLLKMDLLGLKTLSVIRRTIESVKQLTGEQINLESINLNDQRVLRSMVSGDNAGVFQFEADNAVRLLRQIKPTSIDDVSAITSLNRPGCLDMGMHTDYARRKAGLDKTTYLLAELEPIMSTTFGLCVFQEQMLRVFNEIAGFSLGKSDNARRACISGDTILPLGDGTQVSVREYVKCFKNLSEERKSRLVFSLKESHEISMLGFVSDAFFNGYRKVYRVSTLAGREIKVTTDHLFYSNYKWVSIDTGLKVGHSVAVQNEIKLEAESDWDVIVSIDYVGVEDVYDLTVSRYHNFVANGFYVHNCGKKKMKEMLALEDEFIQGCLAKWIDESIAKQLFAIMLASAEYTFNSSHAYCYSVITMITAWLKHYYRCAFMASLMSMEDKFKKKKEKEDDSDNKDNEEEDDKSKLIPYLVKCKSYGIALLPPSINQSSKDFVAVNDSTIRWGLRALHGVGEAALNPILLERQLKPFDSFLDFFKRTRINKTALAALIKSGALDELHNNRAEMLACLELIKRWREQMASIRARIVKWEKEASELMEVDQNSLNEEQTIKHLKRIDQVQKNHDRAINAEIDLLQMPTLEDWSFKQRLEYEREVLGMYASGHPLDKYQEGCEYFNNVQKSETFESIVQVNSVNEGNSKQGPMLHVEIEDKHGAVMALKLFNAQYKEYGHLFKPDAHVSITAKGNEWNGQLNLILTAALKPTEPKEWFQEPSFVKAMEPYMNDDF